jgi:hypothetical protein
MGKSYITGYIRNNDGLIPQVNTEYSMADVLGAMMVRWGFNRGNYRVSPGLYAVGAPGTGSDLFVTGNYKLSFDTLRRNLTGVNCWILVLDTKGVNVWCAAGKGTFSTNELVNRIKMTSLDKVISHRRIILPQLGATGISAHKVKEEIGFNVHYGPVRASDIKEFVEAGYRATREMRKVTFNISDRIKLIPNDFMYGKYYLLGSSLLVFLASFLGREFDLSIDSVKNGFSSILNVFLSYCAGVIFTPLFLPYLPGRQFALKGFFSGAGLFIILIIINKTGSNIVENIAWFAIITAISSFMAMNFTGSSTYTSLSGVKKEMKIALPMQIVFSAVGVILLVTGNFLK